MRYKPINLDEAVFQLTKILPDSTQQQVLSMTEEEFLAGSHFGLGMWIRNNWRLWRGGKLANDFKSKGIFHPDDMSGIILTSYYRQLHNQDWKLDEQISFYQEFWRKQRKHNYRLMNDTAYIRQEVENFEREIRERNEKLKMEFPFGTQVKVWVDYSWLGDRTQVIGEIVDWREVVSKSITTLGTSPKGPKIEFKYLEAKIRIIEFMDIKKKRRVERNNRMTNDELWVTASSMRKIEQETTAN
jgi:hypothetical protein